MEDHMKTRHRNPMRSAGKEIRGGERETVPPESTILTRSKPHQEAMANKFHGFKQRGKVRV